MKVLLLLCILVCSNTAQDTIEVLVEQLETYFTDGLTCTPTTETQNAKNALPDHIKDLIIRLSELLKEGQTYETTTRSLDREVSSSETSSSENIPSEDSSRETSYSENIPSEDSLYRTTSYETSSDESSPRDTSPLINPRGDEQTSSSTEFLPIETTSYETSPRGASSSETAFAETSISETTTEDSSLQLIIDAALHPNIYNVPSTKKPVESTFLPTEKVVTDSSKCDCTMHYLCDDGVVNEDENSVFDLRFEDTDACDSIYQRRCCKKLDKPKTPKPDVITHRKCGLKNPKGLVYRTADKDKNEAFFAEFPWTVMVLKENKTEQTFIYECGGSLIHPQVVLTIAHCVRHLTSKYKIRAGEWDTLSLTDNEYDPLQDREVLNIILHEKFNLKGALNDIALLILDEPVKIARNVDLLCLPKQDQVVDATKCISTGWGRDVGGTKNRNILKKVNLPIVSHEVCQKNLRTTRLGPHFKLDDSFMCAGGENGIDTCQGDGGSPLMCPIHDSPDRYYQAGIVAWGISCGVENIPGVYVNVALYVDWINSYLSKYGFKLCNY